MTDPATRERWLSQCVDAVERLARPASDQLSYLATLGVEGSVDELGLEFDDAWKPLSPLLDRPEDQPLRNSLQAIDAALSDEELPWTETGVSGAAQWDDVRLLAQRVLSLVDRGS